MPQVKLLTAIMILISVMSRCVLGVDAREATPEPLPLVGAIFVGATSDAGALVAVIIADPSPGTTPREARAYLCDGAAISVWFDQGGVDGDAIALTAEHGEQLTATLGREDIIGTIRIADGESLAFQARPAIGLAGLYTATVQADGRFAGASQSGIWIAGTFVSEPAPDGSYAGLATLTLPTGEEDTLPLQVTTLELTELLFIIAEDGQVAGADRIRVRGSSSTLRGTSDGAAAARPGPASSQVSPPWSGRASRILPAADRSLRPSSQTRPSCARPSLAPGLARGLRQFSSVGYSIGANYHEQHPHRGL